MRKLTMLKTTAARKRIALIDADGILYACALRGETTCDGEQLQVLDLGHVYKECMERIEALVDEVEADDAFVILSARRTFRLDILPSYKSNRKGGPRPLLLDELRALMMAPKAPYKAMLIQDLEADDVCGIAAGTLQRAGKEPVIVSPDKDLLQIPGLVFQSLPTNSRTRGKREIVEVTEQSGDDFHLRQTLSGDPVDGYKGCPGIGNVKARKLVESFVDLTPRERWVEIVRCYAEKGLTEGEALVQARVARILRVSDWDPVKKVPLLWTPQTA
jgi:hypothetical protein